MADGGRFTQQSAAKLLRRAPVSGSSAAVLEAPPYPQGGVHGGHIIVLWNAGGHGYVMSAHGEGMTRAAVIRAALRMARSSKT